MPPIKETDSASDPADVSLDTIDARLADFIDGQKARQASADQKAEEVEKQRVALLKKIQAHDSSLADQKKILDEIQGKVNSIRFNAGDDHGSDQLRNAIPEDLRSWIPRFRFITPAAISRSLGSGVGADVIGEAAAKAATADPILLVAICGWFQARIKQAIAARKGGPETARHWNERANNLAKAMGGFHDDQVLTMRDEMPSVTKADLLEGSDATGGYLVPVITEAVIAAILKESSVVRSAGATVLQMTAPKHELPNLANDFTVSWDTEGALIADAAPAAPFGLAVLNAKRQTGLVTPSIELIQDSLLNIFTFLIGHLLQQTGREEDGQALEGDGTVFEGLFSVAGTKSVAGGSAAITWPKWVKAAYAAEFAPAIDRGVYFSHPWVVRDLITTPLTDASNNIATVSQMMIQLSPMGSVRPTTIGAKVVHTTSKISRVRGGGTETTVYHGDPQYLVFGDRMGMQFEANPYSESEWKRGKISLRLIRRVGFVVWLPGVFSKLTAITVAA